MSKLPIIGRVAAVNVKDDAKLGTVMGKIDSGAYLGAIWASNVHEKDGTLYFTLFDKGSQHYTGTELTATEFYTTNVENSFGDSQERYVVFLQLHCKNTEVPAEPTRFSLCDRSMKRYPILIGRSYLRDRFLIDVRINDETTEAVDEEKGEKKVDEE